MRDHKIVELQIPNSSEYISVVRNTVADIASKMCFDSMEVEDLRLAVGEACANAVRHGCSGTGQCSVRVLCRVNGSSIEIEIRNPIESGAEQPTICAVCQPSPEGGMGLYMMRKLMDEVNLDWTDDEAVVRMVKRHAR